MAHASNPLFLIEDTSAPMDIEEQQSDIHYNENGQPTALSQRYIDEQEKEANEEKEEEEHENSFITRYTLKKTRTHLEEEDIFGLAFKSVAAQLESETKEHYNSLNLKGHALSLLPYNMTMACGDREVARALDLFARSHSNELSLFYATELYDEDAKKAARHRFYIKFEKLKDLTTNKQKIFVIVVDSAPTEHIKFLENFTAIINKEFPKLREHIVILRNMNYQQHSKSGCGHFAKYNASKLSHQQLALLILNKYMLPENKADINKIRDNAKIPIRSFLLPIEVMGICEIEKHITFYKKTSEKHGLSIDTTGLKAQPTLVDQQQKKDFDYVMEKFQRVEKGCEQQAKLVAERAPKRQCTYRPEEAKRVGMAVSTTNEDGLDLDEFDKALEGFSQDFQQDLILRALIDQGDSRYLSLDPESKQIVNLRTKEEEENTLVIKLLQNSPQLQSAYNAKAADIDGYEFRLAMQSGQTLFFPHKGYMPIDREIAREVVREAKPGLLGKRKRD